MKKYRGKDVKIKTSNGEEIDFNNYTFDYDYNDDFENTGWAKVNYNCTVSLSGFNFPTVKVSFKIIYFDDRYVVLKTWIEGRKEHSSSIGYYKMQEDSLEEVELELQDLPAEAREEVLKEII